MEVPPSQTLYPLLILYLVQINVLKPSQQTSKTLNYIPKQAQGCRNAFGELIGSHPASLYHHALKDILGGLTQSSVCNATSMVTSQLKSTHLPLGHF